MSRAILFDSTLCAGCRECEKGCAGRWGLAYNDAIAAEEKLSARKLTTIQTRGERYTRKLCMHCLTPSCASACPVGALQKTGLGPVTYEESRCIGCRYCMVACAFQVPVYEWSSRTPRVKKCNLCYERGAKGKPTACSEACPTGATVSGERESLIAEAERRITEKPSEYYPAIYGIEEVGGTSVLFLSDAPFDALGLKTVPSDTLPMLTGRVLALVPDVVSAGAVLLGGVYWLTHRRAAVAAAERSGGKRSKAEARIEEPEPEEELR